MPDSIVSTAAEEVPCPVLHEILRTGKVVDKNGNTIPLHSNLLPHYAVALYRSVKAQRPKLVIEIGMAYGISTLAILAALNEIGDGRLISIDPAQSSYWAGSGQTSVHRAGFDARHTMLEDYDYYALPRLLQAGERAQFGYIDGIHTFDYALVDFFYVDKLLDPNGVVGFNDCGYRSVNRVINFVKGHRRYAEIDVGLPPDYSARNPLVSLARRAMHFSAADRYFRKIESFEPESNFYRSF